MALQTSGQITTDQIANEYLTGDPTNTTYNGFNVDLNNRRWRSIALKMVDSSNIAMDNFYGAGIHYIETSYRSTVNGATSPSPVNNWYRRYVFKTVYTASEMQQSGFNAAYNAIYQISFNVQSVPTYQPYPDYRIYLQQTNIGPTGIDITSGWTEVYYSSSQSFAVGENSFTLNGTFAYFSGQNLAVCVAWGQSPTFYSQTGVAFGETGGGFSSNYNQSDSGGTYFATDSAPLTTAFRPSYRYRVLPNRFPGAVNNNGTATGTQPNPANNYFRRQLLKWGYSSSEMKTQMRFSGPDVNITLRRIALYVVQPPTNQPLPNYKIYLQPNSDGNTTGGWTQVYISGSQTLVTGWNYFNISYTWNTASSLAICFAWAQCPITWTTTGQTLLSTGTMWYEWTDGGGEYFATDNAASTQTYRPQVHFSAVIA